MTLRNHELFKSAMLLLAAVFTTTTISCSNPKKDFEKAKLENTIQGFQDLIKKYPESEYAKEANKIIHDLAFNKAKTKKTIAAFEGYIDQYPQSHHVGEAKKIIIDIAYNEALKKNTNKAYNNFIEKYNPDDDYKSKINEQIRQKQKYLRLAIETHRLAQQETDDSIKKELFNKTSELYNKANFKEAMLYMTDRPLLNLHLAEESKLKKVINRPFRSTRYTYGSSTDQYEYLLKNEQLNNYTLYNFILASAGKTNFLVKVILKRGGKKYEICRNKFLVCTKYYTGYSGLIENKDIALKKRDKIILILNATGDNYGISCNNYDSYIKMLKPNITISDVTISQRTNALSWVLSKYKNAYPSSIILSFIAQIDLCLLENKSGEWLIGSENIRNKEPYRLKWYNNTFTAERLENKKAKDLGEKAVKFSELGAT